MKGTFRVEG